MGTLRRGLAAACSCALLLATGCVVSEKSYKSAVQERDHLAAQLAESREQVAIGEAQLGQAYQDIITSNATNDQTAGELSFTEGQLRQTELQLGQVKQTLTATTERLAATETKLS